MRCCSFFSPMALPLPPAPRLGFGKPSTTKPGQPKSHVELYLRNGKLYGKIVRLLQKPADTLCEKCKGDKKDKPVLAMVIVEHLTQEGGVWKRGNHPRSRIRKHVCLSIWLEDGNLRVRGKHWTGLFRTQTWYRVQEPK